MSVITYSRKPVQEAALGCGIKPPHGCVDNGIQELLKHPLGSPESGKILDDEGQKEDKTATDSDGCEYPDVKHRVFISRRELDVLCSERHVRVRQYMVVSG